MVDSKHDNKLRERVQSLLKKDKDLSMYDLNADVVEGEAQVQGIVDTLKEKERALDLVRQIPGIKGVANAISISTDGDITTKDIAMEVQEELEMTPDVNLNHIGAESEGGHGIVVLKGQTDNHTELEAAIDAASKARGVTKVISQVKLGESELSLDDIFHSQVNNDKKE